MSRTETGLTIDTAAGQRWDLSVVVALREEEEGPVRTASERVDPVSDLADHRSEFWRDAFLCRGRLVSPSDLCCEVLPLFDSRKQCSGFMLIEQDAAGEQTGKEFSIHALRHVAGRAARKLAPDGHQNYVYAISAKPAGDVQHGAGRESDASFRIRVEEKPFSYVDVPLHHLTQDARLVNDDLESNGMPVFIPVRVLTRLETTSRQGAHAEPPIETGAALLGCPARCPETGAFGIVVTDCLDLVDVESKQDRLSYSGSTWSHIQQVVRRRQSACPAEGIVGQGHGHPFDRKLFVDLPPCDRCSDTSQRCSRHNVAPSGDDQNWHRAVFAGRMPFQVCMIYGYDARGPRHGCFTLHDGQLCERPYYAIDDFTPADWPVRSIAPRG